MSESTSSPLLLLEPIQALIERIENRLGNLQAEGAEHLRYVDGHPPLGGPDPECPACDDIFGEASLLKDALAALLSRVGEAQPATGLIPLSARQEQRVQAWAADDRLWTTQDSVEINLRTFARDILEDFYESRSPDGDGPLAAEQGLGLGEVSHKAQVVVATNSAKTTVENCHKDVAWSEQADSHTTPPEAPCAAEDRIAKAFTAAGFDIASASPLQHHGPCGWWESRPCNCAISRLLPAIKTALQEREAQIRALQAENAEWKGWGIIEVAVRNRSVSDYMNHWEGRTLEAEADLRQVTAELNEAHVWWRALRERAEYAEANLKTVREEIARLRSETSQPT